ncbi:MAG: hypothetical protein IJT65_02040 [Eubacterium sp.]|nr:hypothetical protein [Eubacterium sp.]
MDNSGWICLNRKILNWEWYQNNNVKAVFIHCLLKANYEDKRWQGHIIHRGEFITSYDTLSRELSMSVNIIRNAIKKLIESGEIEVKSTNKNTLIKCLNYSAYQDKPEENHKQTTIKSQTNHKQSTTTNNNNNKNKYNNKKGRIKREPNFDLKELYEKAIHNDNYDI